MTAFWYQSGSADNWLTEFFLGIGPPSMGGQCDPIAAGSVAGPPMSTVGVGAAVDVQALTA